MGKYIYIYIWLCAIILWPLMHWRTHYKTKVWRQGMTTWRDTGMTTGMTTARVHTCVTPKLARGALPQRAQMSTGPPNRDKGMTALWRNYDDCHTWGSLSFFCMSLHHEVDASGLPRPLVNRDSCKRETPCTWQGYDGKVWRQGMTARYDDSIVCGGPLSLGI